MGDFEKKAPDSFSKDSFLKSFEESKNAGFIPKIFNVDGEFISDGRLRKVPISRVVDTQGNFSDSLWKTELVKLNIIASLNYLNIPNIQLNSKTNQVTFFSKELTFSIPLSELQGNESPLNIKKIVLQKIVGLAKTLGVQVVDEYFLYSKDGKKPTILTDKKSIQSISSQWSGKRIHESGNLFIIYGEYIIQEPELMKIFNSNTPILELQEILSK